MPTQIDIRANQQQTQIQIEPRAAHSQPNYTILDNAPQKAELTIQSQTNNVEFDVTTNSQQCEMEISDVVVRGPAGKDAGFGIIDAEAITTQVPTAEVITSGPNTEKNLHFIFGIPPGGGSSNIWDVQINDISTVTNAIAKLVANGIYNAISNPLATMESINTDNLLQGENTLIINGGGPDE